MHAFKCPATQPPLKEHSCLPPTGPLSKSLLPPLGCIPSPRAFRTRGQRWEEEAGSPQVSEVVGEGKEELGEGTQGGKGGTAEVQSERAEETAKEEGQGRPEMGTAGHTPRSCPCSLAVALAPYLEPPCWSEPCCPPRRAGGTTVSSPRLLWGPSLLCRKSPWEETTGPAPYGRENTLAKAHPSRQ